MTKCKSLINKETEVIKCIHNNNQTLKYLCTSFVILNADILNYDESPKVEIYIYIYVHTLYLELRCNVMIAIGNDRKY